MIALLLCLSSVNAQDNINITKNSTKSNIINTTHVENIKTSSSNSKVATNVTIDNNIKGKIGDNVTLKADVKTNDNKAVNGGKVIFKVNKETLKINNDVVYIPVVNSTAKLNYTIPKSWNKTISLEAAYSGNSQYESSRTNTPLVLNDMKLDTKIIIKSYNLKSGENVKLSSIITDQRGDLVSGGKVIYKINGATIKDSSNNQIEVRVKNGSAILNYTTPKSWTNKDITIQAVYSGNEIFTGSRSTPVENKVKESIINTENLIKTTNDIIYVNVNVTDETGSLVKDGKVTLYQNNVKIGTNALINGSRQLYLGKMKAGVHKYTINFTSNNYLNASQTITITIKNVTPQVSLMLDIPQASQKDKKLELRAYAYFNNTKTLKSVDKGYVIFKIDGKTIKNMTLTNSKALYNYTMPNDESSHIIDAYYISDSYGNNSDTKIIKTTTASNLNSKNTAIKGNKDPFKEKIALINEVPNLSLMTNYVWADENATYTLTKSQYMEVTIRDSYSLYLNNYMSKYVAFKTKNEPNTYHVLRREKWNVIEQALNKKLVLSNGGAYPETLTVSLKGLEYTYSEVRDIQNTSYTCGPTSLSMCTQVLKTYTSEYRLSVNAGSTSSAGTKTSGLKYAASLHNMTATYFYNTTFDKALNELSKGACALIFHTWNHYVAILDISTDKQKVLVGNPSGTYNEGSHSIPTKWLTVSYMKQRFNNYDTSGLIVKLNYNLNSTTKNQVNNMYYNFGGKYTRSNTNERIPNV